jgi:hypothetical protein
MDFHTLTPTNITLALMGVVFYFLVNLSKAKAKNKKKFNGKKYISDNWLNIVISTTSIFPLLIIAVDLVDKVNYVVSFSIGFLNSSLLRSVIVVAQNALVKKEVPETTEDQPHSEETDGDH